MKHLVVVPFMVTLFAVTIIPLQITTSKSVYILFFARNLTYILCIGAAWFAIAYFVARRVNEAIFLGERGAKLQVDAGAHQPKAGRRA